MPQSSTPSPQTEQDLPDIAFPLPGGSALRYWFPKKGVSYKNASLTWMSRGLLRRAKKKEYCPAIAGWNTHTREQLVIADFDKEEKLPKDYPTFDALHGHLKSAYAGSGIVVRSYSNNVKLIFIIRLMDERPMDMDTALGFLKEQLGDGLYSAIDKNPSAQHTLGLTPEIVEELRRSLAVISITPLYRSSVGEGQREPVTSCIPIQRDTQSQFTKYEGLIEELHPDLRRYINRSKIREVLVRWLLHRRELIKDTGFDLPSTWIAKQLDVRQGKVTEALKKAQSNGLLKLIDDSYAWWGAKPHGKTYIAIGALAEEIQRLAPKHKKPPPFPEYIEDHTWEDTLFELALKYYRFPDEYMENFRCVPGWNLKDRPEKALRAINSVRKWNELPEYVPSSSLKDTA